MATATPKPLLFLSFDIEADGPAPGLNSMLSMGFVGINEAGQFVFQFEANLKPLPDANPDSKTLQWWAHPDQAAAVDYIAQNQRDPKEAFQLLVQHIDKLKAEYQVRCVAWPIAYDWQWINYYFHRFIGSNPLGHSATDIGSYAWGLLGTKTHNVGKLEEFKDPKLPHTHKALDDAKEQGMVFYNLWRKGVKAT